MRFSIRSKLVISVVLLISILFSLTAFLFIGEKKNELTEELYNKVYSFSRLTSGSIVDDYDLYMTENSFIYFNREIKKFFNMCKGVDKIQVVSYVGEILYDSIVDVEKKYDGVIARQINSEDLIGQIQSESVSIKVAGNGIIYVKENDDGNYNFVDANEKSIEFDLQGERYEYFVVPVDDKYSTVYYLNYDDLDASIDAMRIRIIYMAAFGVLLGIIFSIWMASTLTKPIHQLEKGVKKIALGDFSARVYIKTKDEVAFLADSFNKMAQDLSASIKAKLYQERISRELELAKQIQDQLIPKVIPKADGIDIAAALLPAGEIGGDMYDFLPSYPGHYSFYLGDVTGHGVPAGIVSSIASALFYGFANSGNLKEIVIEVNRVLRKKTMSNMFMTMCLLDWEFKLNKMSFVSAGHEQILHYSAAAEAINLAPAGGLAIGMVQDISPHLKIEQINMSSGDFIVIYSDGIPEAWMSKTETYGMERFMQSVTKNSKLKTAEEIKNAILIDLKNFVSGYKQMDDITILVIKKL